MAETFGQKLKRWREAAHISQAELARRMEVSPNWISNLERDFSPTAKGGKPQPSVETCDKIAHALGVKIAEVRLAAGYAPPNGMEPEPSRENNELKEREAAAARTTEMVANWMTLSPEKQAQILAVMKVLKEEHPELLQILGPSFEIIDSDQITESDVKEIQEP